MGQQVDPKSDPNNAQLRKALDEVTPQLHGRTRSTRCCSCSAARSSATASATSSSRASLDSIKKDNKIETDEQFQAALKQENMTMADLRRNLERQMIVSRVQQNEVLGKIGVTDDEARKYYDAHQERVHDAADDHAARDPRRGAERSAKGVNVGADEQAQEPAPRRSGTRVARRRELREAGGGPVRRAVARQRRPDRPAQPQRPVAGRCAR